jgi:hypothetical protein
MRQFDASADRGTVSQGDGREMENQQHSLEKNKRVEGSTADSACYKNKPLLVHWQIQVHDAHFLQKFINIDIHIKDPARDNHHYYNDYRYHDFQVNLDTVKLPFVQLMKFI